MNLAPVSPHCFTCMHHEKIGKNKKECYCMANFKYTGQKELIKELSTRECKAWKNAELWQTIIDNDLFND